MLKIIGIKAARRIARVAKATNTVACLQLSSCFGPVLVPAQVYGHVRIIRTWRGVSRTSTANVVFYPAGLTLPASGEVIS